MYWIIILWVLLGLVVSLIVANIVLGFLARKKKEKLLKEKHSEKGE